MSDGKVIIDRGLIYDIGANSGDDSSYHLAKGFRVVAVDASPVMAEILAGRFKAEIADQRLIVLNQGIVSEPGTFTFYRNLDNDHWSSFDPAYGTRNSTRYETIDVPCDTIATIVQRYGPPYYMKIDVEGADKSILQGLQGFEPRPAFVSVEEYGVQALRDLQGLGYEAFFISPQRDKSWAKLPDPSREGTSVARVFTGYDSGPFGLDLPREWMSFADAYERFTTTVRREDQTYVGPEHEWHDIHATTWSAV